VSRKNSDTLICVCFRLSATSENVEAEFVEMLSGLTKKLNTAFATLGHEREQVKSKILDPLNELCLSDECWDSAQVQDAALRSSWHMVDPNGLIGRRSAINNLLNSIG
jgi:hypothetical protein